MESPKDLKWISVAKQSLNNQLKQNDDILFETDLAAIMEDTTPKAQYHFLIVAKAQIEKVTELTREHLPLLDHMMELANKIIEEQQHLPSSCFLVGFKIDAFMDSLTMHVISNDFNSKSMKLLKHWNGFNTDLFLSYQTVYARLQTEGCIEPMPEKKALELRGKTKLRCNQCHFEYENLVSLKNHLHKHWLKREAEIAAKKQLENLTQKLQETKLENATEVAAQLPHKFAPTKWRLDLRFQQETAAKNWRQLKGVPPKKPNKDAKLANTEKENQKPAMQ